MDGVLGQVDTGYISVPKTEIVSHGNWPVKNLVPGQTIRFSSRNYDNKVVMEIRKVVPFENMILVSGNVINDVAFDIHEMVELVSVREVQYAG